MYLSIRTSKATANIGLTALIHEMGGDIEISHKSGSAFPIPWDADICIMDGMVSMAGRAGEGGWGNCTTTFHAEVFPNFAMSWQVRAPDTKIPEKLVSLGFDVSHIEA